ncbi:peptidase M20 family protein [Tieghemostelium lacteum]|uniref:Peptidase M20 family protein n=1 Tax=Tieghemostelium lacteum TaxID=361077 RepID=A0A151Z4L8_TIELA|nr:peptidase M20 family protein [Tieghemostelium lacteum]|eukprot:KYQ88744.1 peptidase M20 family protein [Tieghemostelium lacteum]
MIKSITLTLLLTVLLVSILPAVESIPLIKTPLNYASDFAGSLKIKTISFDPSDTENSFNGTEFILFRQYLETKFPKVHATCTRTIINTYSLLFKWQGSNTSLKPIFINGHFDVVPATAAGWLTDPWNGTIMDGFIYGRGTIDNKLIVMSSLEAIEAMLTANYVPKRTIYLAFGHDEELGGNNGHKYISDYLKSQNITAEMLIDEGSPIMKENFLPGINKTTALVGINEKGYLFYNLSVTTPGGHSAMPPPETAIGIIAKAALAIETHPFPNYPLSVINSEFLNLFNETNIANVPYLSSMLKTTTAVTMFKAGIKSNVIATSATVWINHRIIAGSNVTYTLNRVRELVNDSRVQLVIDGSKEPSPISPPSAQAYKLVKKSLKKVYGDIRVVTGQMFANTDTRHYWDLTPNIYRLMPVVCSYAEFSTMHGYNEKISVDDYMKAIKFYKKLILKFQTCGQQTTAPTSYLDDSDQSDCDC